MFCAHLLTHRTTYYNHPPNQKTEEGGGWGGEVSRGEDRVEKSREEERREGREQRTDEQRRGKIGREDKTREVKGTPEIVELDKTPTIEQEII